MTFQNIQDRVMARLNLSSTDARARIKDEINEKYHALFGMLGLDKTRVTTTATLATSNAVNLYTITAVKVLTVRYAGGRRTLDQMSLDQLRNLDPGLTQSGAPQAYAVAAQHATTIDLFLYPTPDAVYTLALDQVTAVADLSANGDIPVFPEDFHDILVRQVLGEEWAKLEKQGLADKEEEKAMIKIRELRYFIRKSAYLSQQQASGPVIGQTGAFYGPNSWLP